MSELPRGWARATVLELAGKTGVVTDGDWVESKDQDPSGSVRLIQLADIGDGYFVDKSNRYMNLEAARRLNCTFLRPGDVLIARMPDPLGRACIFPDIGQEAVTAVDVFVWRPDNALAGARPRWLMHTINSPYVRALLHNEAGGTTRQRVSGGKIKNLSLPVPPLPEQERLVAKVDGLNARTARARAHLDRIPTLIARYKQRLLALAFSGELTAGWRVERNLPDPKPMSLAKLSDGLRYGTAQKSYEEPKGIAVLRIPNVAFGRIRLDDLKYAELDSKEIEKLTLRDGDILVVRSNGSVDLVGRPALVSGEAVGMAYAGYLIRIRPNRNLVSPQFLTFMLEAPAIRRVIEEGARSTSGVNNVNAKELGDLQIPIFHLQEQTEITCRIASAFAWLERMSADHTAATKLIPKLDAAILGKAFHGELVPQDPIDEPADALLKRIQATREIVPKAKQVRKLLARKEHAAMRRTLEDVLSEASDWLPAQEAFQRCGMPENADTNTIEDLYSELRILDKAGRLEVKSITDDQGRKLSDHLKLKA